MGQSQKRSARVALAIAALSAALLPALASAAARQFGLTITSGPAESETVASSSATFAFAAHATTFSCTLDAGAAENCDSGEITYEGLPNGPHTFRVEASAPTDNPDQPSSESQTRNWIVAAPPETMLTGNPPDPSEHADASFSFTSDAPDATFECSLDGAAFEPCSSPIMYSDLEPKSHLFEVRAVDGGIVDETPASYTWKQITGGASSATTTRNATTTPDPTTTRTETQETSDSSASPWPWIGAALGAATLVAAAVVGLIGRHRRALLARWQHGAETERPPEHCQGEGHYTWRKECKPKPALRRVEAVTLHATTSSGDKIEHAADDTVVDGLNSAVLAHRLLRGRDDLIEKLSPVATELASAAENWDDVRSGEAIAVSAHLTGGKLECEFTRFECVRQGSDRVWKPIRTWKAEIAHESDEPVGEIGVSAKTDKSSQLETLEKTLLDFVEHVDIPDILQPPETSPALSP